MRRIRYSKYVPDLASEMSMEDLLQALSDYLLNSGFQDQYFYDMNQQTLEELRQAIEQALMSGDMFDDEQVQQQLEQMQQEGRLDELIEQIIRRMEREDYVSIDQPHEPSQRSSVGGQVGENQAQAKFEITDKSLDFLGYKTLRDLLGSLGKSNFGRHDTRDLATGIEASGASRQCEYQSSCATVMMLDCSHSMILYGEDRFTPAKKVAMALSQLIRTQYPGDS